MKVAVTGAAGLLGRTAVTALTAAGIEVLAVDRQFSHLTPGIAPLRADLNDLGQVYGALAGQDAVLHLAAIPAPTGLPAEEVFRNNTAATFHVYEAAARLGIRRVVSASSISAYGFPFQHRWSVPDYFPIDEGHPLLPQDSYGLSKAVGEQIAEAYVRRGAGDAVSLRISHVVDDTTIKPLLAITAKDPAKFAPELWSYVHVRDVAQACLLALTRPLDGRHVAVHVTAAGTTSTLPTDELLARWFPEVPIREHEADEHWSLIDASTGRSVLAYEPTYSWTTEQEENA
ncbi:NAD-dependent epimerase/dehydratase family protein [Actinospica robiniae]|uniref:NAD-dependent epimerase/dehydratase family protein n=1 Tax=Actinospica robiniae TaxID=304901 RepID=UPI00040309BA|nr:NAD(P)-dependent oxidoreductase [Actinospica robiniae]